MQLFTMGYGRWPTQQRPDRMISLVGGRNKYPCEYPSFTLTPTWLTFRNLSRKQIKTPTVNTSVGVGDKERGLVG